MRTAWQSLAIEHPSIATGFRIAALVVLFLAFEIFVMRVCRLSEEAYAQPILGVEVLRRLGPIPCVLLAAIIAVWMRYGGLMLRWSELDDGRILRVFIVFLALLMVWPLTTYGYNYYLGQGHYLDRAMLVLLLALLWWRPAFIYPFVLLAFTLLWQFGVPSLGGTIFAHKLQVLHVLNMFAAFLALRTISGPRSSDDFIFMTCCLVAAAYWLPALSKLQLNWLADTNLHLLPLAAYSHGWLSFLEADTVARLSQWILPLDFPLALFVLSIEALCLVFLWRRALSIGLLAAVILFHAGVFLYYGFLFWTWIALDAGLLLILLRDLRQKRLGIYSRTHLLISILLIGFAAYWARPPALGWYDTRLTYTYRITAFAEDGTNFTLAPTFFTPYEDVFTMAAFHYLTSEHAVLVAPYGVTKDQDLARAINDADSPADIFALESAVPGVPYDAERSRRFYDFIERYVTAWNQQGQRARWLVPLRAPRQFWSSRGEDPQRSGRTIHGIAVSEITTLFDGTRLQIIREVELGRVDLEVNDRRR